MVAICAIAATAEAGHRHHQRYGAAGCCCQGGCCGTDCAGPLCQAPVTKSYHIKPGLCPAQIAAMIPNCVPATSGDCCGPYGIPAVFASGEWVVVRQTPDVHERINKYLADLGALAPKPTR
jgi:hypothetical protein